MFAPARQTGRTLRWASISLVLALALGSVPFTSGPQPAQAGFGISFDAVESTGTFTFGKETINVWQFEPKSKGKGPFPAILVLHGLEGLEGLDKPFAKEYKQLCMMVASYGYVVHFVHYMNCTPGDCLPKASAQSVTALQNRYKELLVAGPGKEDTEATKRFAEWMACANQGLANLRAQNGKVDKDRVGVIGLSMGGFIATALAVTEPKTFQPQAIVVAFGGLPPRLHKQKFDKLPPVLMICGKTDDIVPFQHAQDACKCLENNQCSVRFEAFDCNHMFFDGKGKLQLGLVLRAQGMAREFLQLHVEKAKKGDKVTK